MVRKNIQKHLQKRSIVRLTGWVLLLAEQVKEERRKNR